MEDNYSITWLYNTIKETNYISKGNPLGMLYKGEEDKSDLNLSKLDFIFLYFHDNLNKLIKKLFTKINENKNKPTIHFNAVDSRSFINLIEQIHTLQNALLQTTYKFEINENYNLLIKQINRHLKETMGSEIPGNIKEFDLVTSDRIFNICGNSEAFITENSSAEEIFEKVSLRNTAFKSMTISEKLFVINIALENLWKNKHYNSVLNNEACYYHEIITNDNVKNYRKKTHCFRHGTDKNLKERKEIKEHHEFLLNYGLIACNVIAFALVNIL